MPSAWATLRTVVMTSRAAVESSLEKKRQVSCRKSVAHKKTYAGGGLIGENNSVSRVRARSAFCRCCTQGEDAERTER